MKLLDHTKLQDKALILLDQTKALTSVLRSLVNNMAEEAVIYFMFTNIKSIISEVMILRSSTAAI